VVRDDSPDRRIVIDHEYSFHADPPARGKAKRNVLPLPSTLSTSSRAPCRARISMTSVIPSPVPPIGRVSEESTRKKRSPSRRTAASDIPIPVSRTSTSTPPLSHTRTQTWPPWRLYLTALSTRLVSTCWIASTSPRNGGRFGG